MDSPFHLGEQQIQSRLGMRDKLEDIGRRMIRDHMPEQHREFFALLPWLLVGSRDADGQPQASVLWGAPGFASSPQPQRLRIDTLPEADDPLAANLRAGTGLGLLGIELPTRRRNRMNGRVEALSDGGFAVTVQQSFGNCPKYIGAQLAGRHAPAGPAGTGRRPRSALAAAGRRQRHPVHRQLQWCRYGYLPSRRPARICPPGKGRPPVVAGLQRQLHVQHPRQPAAGAALRAAVDRLRQRRPAAPRGPCRAGLAEDYPEPAPPGAERMLALSPGRWRLRRGRLPLAFGSAEPSPFLPAQGH